MRRLTYLTLPIWLLLFGLLMWSRAQAEELRIGIEPYISPRVLIANFQGLRAYMQKQLGSPVVILTAPDYRQFIRRIEVGDFDMVLVGPHSVRYAQEKVGYQPLAKASARLSALVVVKQDSRYRQLSDLSGATVALPSPLTATAMLGEDLLDRAGLKSGHNVYLRYFDFHNTAALMVARGEVQAAIVNNSVFTQLGNELRESLRVINESPTLPYMMIAVHPRYDSQMRDVLRKALVGFSSDPEAGKGFVAKLGFTGLTPVTEADFKGIEPLLARLKARMGAEP